MKRYAVLILLLWCNCAFAADSTIVKFMNGIYKQVVDTTCKYYYVIDEGKNPELSANSINILKQDSSKQFASIPFDEFLSSINSDTSKIKWSNYNAALPKARFTDYAHLPFMMGQQDVIKILPLDVKQSVIDSLERKHIICVRVKPNLTEAQIQDEIHKTAMVYIKRPKEERNYYLFSKPVFSVNREYAYIKVDQNLHGCTYIFKKVAGKWVAIFEGWWIS